MPVSGVTVRMDEANWPDADLEVTKSTSKRPLVFSMSCKKRMLTSALVASQIQPATRQLPHLTMVLHSIWIGWPSSWINSERELYSALQLQTARIRAWMGATEPKKVLTNHPFYESGHILHRCTSIHVKILVGKITPRQIAALGMCVKPACAY